jgi:hypothetical protein
MCFLRMGKVSFFRFDVLKSALADEFDQWKNAPTADVT